MIIYVDIDDTICVTEKQENASDYDYSKSIPIKKNIEKVNKLYDDGHIIVYYTARGAVTRRSWYLLTKEQLKRWGAKHHRLKCDKPFYDLFIDDKAITSLEGVEDYVKKIG